MLNCTGHQQFRGSQFSWVPFFVGPIFCGSRFSWVPNFVGPKFPGSFIFGHFPLVIILWVILRGSIFVGHYLKVNFRGSFWWINVGGSSFVDHFSWVNIRGCKRQTWVKLSCPICKWDVTSHYVCKIYQSNFLQILPV